MMTLRLIKGKAVDNILACKGTKRVELFKKGLLTKPIRRSAIDSVWPEHEVQAIAAATVAGQSEAQIKELVTRLHAARAQLCEAA
jgi:hypothetical protein